MEPEATPKYKVRASLADSGEVTLYVSGQTWSEIGKENIMSMFDTIADFLIRETQEKESP